MPQICPHAEPVGVAVKCRVQGKVVNPLRMPCRARYEQCRYYVEAVSVVKPPAGRTCSECVYYGALSSRCLAYGFTVKDPGNPPCRGYFK